MEMVEVALLPQLRHLSAPTIRGTGPNPTLYYCNARSYDRAVSRLGPLIRGLIYENDVKQESGMPLRYRSLTRNFLFRPLRPCHSILSLLFLRYRSCYRSSSCRICKSNRVYKAQKAIGDARALSTDISRTANPEIKCDTKCGCAIRPRPVCGRRNSMFMPVGFVRSES